MSAPDHALSATQQLVLAVLPETEPGTRVRAIANQLGLSCRYTRRLVRSLELRGLVVPQDRRPTPPPKSVVQSLRICRPWAVA